MLTWPARRALLRTQPSGHVPPPHRCANLPVGCAASYAPLAPVGCVNDCMGRGSCHDGVCECQPGWTYFDCSIRAPTRGALAPPPRAPTPASPGPTAAVCRDVRCRLLRRRPVLQRHVPMPRRLLRRRLLAEVLTLTLTLTLTLSLTLTLTLTLTRCRARRCATRRASRRRPAACRRTASACTCGPTTR